MTGRLAALLAMALLAAGCGGGGERMSKEEYRTELHPALAEMSGHLNDVTAATRSLVIGPEVAQQVDDAREGIRDVAEDLDEMEPPQDAEGAHDKLVDALEQIADAYAEVSDAARKEGRQAASGTLQNMLDRPFVDLFDSALNELRRKGYLNPARR